MMEVKGIIKTRARAYRYFLAAVILFMVFIEIYTKKIVYILITLLVLMATFLKKEHIVSESGVNIKYSLFGQVIDTLWTWDQVTGVAVDYHKAAPEVMLYLGKNMSTRAFKITKKDVDTIKFLVKQCKPGLKIDKIVKE